MLLLNEKPEPTKEPTRASARLAIAAGMLGLSGWALIYHLQVKPISRSAGLAIALVLAALALSAASARIARIGRWLARHLERTARRNPRRAIAICSLAAVIASCYPVLFFGRSFAGPGYSHAIIMYDTGGTLPKLAPENTQNQGADVGVLPWALVPNHFIVQNSILQHHEWPFWNRYSYSGDMLLGQMQSSLGDPLQVFVWLAKGGAWGWDCKYLAAKFLFCLCVGMIALELTGSLPASVFVAMMNSFLGAFMRTFNHPEFFVLTFAPVILLTATCTLRARGWRRLFWAVSWGGACMTAVHSGAIKGGATSCVAMTGLGWTYVLMNLPAGESRRRLLWVGGALILGISALNAPLLWPFVIFRDSVYHGSDIPTSVQSPHQLLGLFDYLFYRAPGYGSPIPPATLVHLPLLVLAVVCAAHHRASSGFRLLVIFCICEAAIVFGAIPSRWLEHIPILSLVGHLDRDLGYQLAGVGIPLMAAFGWCSVGRLARSGAGWFPWLSLVLVLGLLIGWQAVVDPAPPWTSAWKGYAYVAVAAAALVPAFIFAGYRLPGIGAAATVLAALAVGSPAFARNIFVHRHDWDKFFMVPGPRPDFAATSAAIDALAADAVGRTDPGRIVGTRLALFGNYEAVWGFEDIRGNNPMVNRVYESWLDASAMIHLPRLANWVIAIDAPAAARPLLNVLNVRELVSLPHEPPTPGYPVRLRSDLTLTQNQTAWPRAFYSPSALAAAGPAEFWVAARKFGDSPFITLEPATLEAAHQVPATKPGPIEPARDYRLTPNRTAFVVDAPAAGWVFLSEGYRPGHVRATVNGVSQRVERADGALEALRISSAGRYRIEFHYMPDGWNYAAGVGLLGIAALGAWAGRLAKGPR